MASTEEELAKLDAEGVPSDQLIWTWYFFSHFGFVQRCTASVSRRDGGRWLHQLRL
jgi:hypothetical protein